MVAKIGWNLQINIFVKWVLLIDKTETMHVVTKQKQIIVKSTPMMLE
jgi:hypothetical protein